MASATPKDYSTSSNYPKALSSIIVSVGLLAVFITLASWILLSHPIGSVVRSYFTEVDETSEVAAREAWVGGRGSEFSGSYKSDEVGSTQLPKSEAETHLPKSEAERGYSRNNGDGKRSDKSVSSGSDSVVQGQDSEDVVPTKNEESVGNVPKEAAPLKPKESVPSGDSIVSKEQDRGTVVQSRSKQSTNTGSNDATSAGVSESETAHGNMGTKGPVESDCDLFHGEWFYDSAGPVYTNNSCPLITQMQNCQGNGRPDKEYENWRWKPSQCELPRFNGTKFLELMSGKTLAFVGDSVARNQMESLLCLLWQVEVPKNRGNRHMQRWYFRSKSVMIVRIWSSWLVHQTAEPFSYVPEGIAKLHLDIPDETFMQYIPIFDVVVLSSGHWFAKQSIYLLNNEIVGTQLWSPPKPQPMKINNIEAFGVSVETSMAAMATHPNFTGLTILRSYSPDHYEGGAWNTGGSCTGKVKPLAPGQLVQNEFTNTMHEKQVTGFHQAVKKQTNKSKLKLMDITDVFSYRHDGHPGPFRSPDPNKITKRGPDGKPPPQDCLHWCMPGPVDTWNELVLEIIRRELERDQNSAS